MRSRSPESGVCDFFAGVGAGVSKNKWYSDSDWKLFYYIYCFNCFTKFSTTSYKYIDTCENSASLFENFFSGLGLCIMQQFFKVWKNKLSIFTPAICCYKFRIIISSKFWVITFLWCDLFRVFGNLLPLPSAVNITLTKENILYVCCFHLKQKFSFVNQLNSY